MNTNDANEHGFRYFDLVMVSFVSVLLISNVASSKFVTLGPLSFDGGTLLRVQACKQMFGMTH